MTQSVFLFSTAASALSSRDVAAFLKKAFMFSIEGFDIFSIEEVNAVSAMASVKSAKCNLIYIWTYLGLSEKSLPPYGGVNVQLSQSQKWLGGLK